jgi:hypothetical protein
VIWISVTRTHVRISSHILICHARPCGQLSATSSFIRNRGQFRGCVVSLGFGVSDHQIWDIFAHDSSRWKDGKSRYHVPDLQRADGALHFLHCSLYNIKHRDAPMRDDYRFSNNGTDICFFLKFEFSSPKFGAAVHLQMDRCSESIMPDTSNVPTSLFAEQPLIKSVTVPC